MYSFQDNIVLKKMRKGENKNSIMAYFKPKQVGKCRERENIKLSFRSVPTRREIENSKQIPKKFEK